VLAQHRQVIGCGSCGSTSVLNDHAAAVALVHAAPTMKATAGLNWLFVTALGIPQPLGRGFDSAFVGFFYSVRSSLFLNFDISHINNWA
jgi:hypothetical protein